MSAIVPPWCVVKEPLRANPARAPTDKAKFVPPSQVVAAQALVENGRKLTLWRLAKVRGVLPRRAANSLRRKRLRCAGVFLVAHVCAPVVCVRARERYHHGVVDLKYMRFNNLAAAVPSPPPLLPEWRK